MSDDLVDKQEVISNERLYRLWEQNNWSATAIDFSTDVDHWHNVFTETQRRSALWNYAMFLVGEEAVARTLTPVLDAAPNHDQKIFLTTQIVDEARHHVFFDRFMREVAGQGSDTKSTLASVESQLTWGFKQVFGELDRLTQELHNKPGDKALLAQVIALYHVIIEGVLAVPGQHFIQRYVKDLELLPGFTEGINNVSRDESRHVAFGVKFLGELVRSSKEIRAAAIELWDRVLPWSAGVFIPPRRDESYVECFGFSLVEIYAFGMRSFQTKLKRIGIDPTEIALLSKEDHSLSFEERARRAWVLIDSGIIGDDRKQPAPTPEALEIIFDGVSRSVDLGVARSLGGPVQWDFEDGQSWHLVVTNGHAEAKPGAAGKPVLRLETTTSDWSKFAVGRADPRWALLRRKLKLHGSLSAKAKLAKLFA